MNFAIPKIPIIKTIGKIVLLVAISLSITKCLELSYVALYGHYKRIKFAVVMDTLTTDLAARPITVDIKNKTVKTIDKFTLEDYRKALWVYQVRYDQLEWTLENVKSAIDYQGVAPSE